MVRTTPALSARTASTRGRGAASQSEAGGWPAITHGRTEGAKIEEERRVEEGSNKEDNDHDKDDKGSKSTSFRELETEEPAKPPAKIQALT